MRTRLGMLIRAGASIPEMVGALGVNIKLLYTLVFGLGAALAGFAGLMQAPILTVQIGMGENILIPAFVVVVIGGIGSIRGAFVAALLVGIIDTIGRAFLPDLLHHYLSENAAATLAPALSSMLIYLLDGCRARGAAGRPVSGGRPMSEWRRACQESWRDRGLPRVEASTPRSSSSLHWSQLTRHSPAIPSP